MYFFSTGTITTKYILCKYLGYQNDAACMKNSTDKSSLEKKKKINLAKCYITFLPHTKRQIVPSWPAGLKANKKQASKITEEMEDNALHLFSTFHQRISEPCEDKGHSYFRAGEWRHRKTSDWPKVTQQYVGRNEVRIALPGIGG